MNGNKKRVLFFRPELTQGGADRVTITLLRRFSREKFDVQLCLLRKAGPLLDEVPSDVKVHDLRAGSLWSAVGPLQRLLRQVKPDVLFSTCSGANVPASIAHALEPGKRSLVLSERNIVIRHPFTAQRLAMPFLKRALYAQADIVTAVSDGVRDDLEQILKVPHDRAITIGNPVVSDEIYALSKKPTGHRWLDDESLNVVANMGRLVPQKGQKMLIRAFARVHASHANARLLILGEGPERAELEQLIDELKLHDVVDLAGFQRNPYQFLRPAKAFVLASWNEGLPGALIQAMALGLPAISTDCRAGPSEIIDLPGDNGFLIEVDDEDQLVQRLDTLLRDKGLRDRIGQAGQQTVRRYAEDVVIDNYQQAVEDSIRLRSAA